MGKQVKLKGRAWHRALTAGRERCCWSQRNRQLSNTSNVSWQNTVIFSHHRCRLRGPCQCRWGHLATVLDPDYPAKDRQKTGCSSLLLCLAFRRRLDWLRSRSETKKIGTLSRPYICQDVRSRGYLKCGQSELQLCIDVSISCSLPPPWWSWETCYTELNTAAHSVQTCCRLQDEEHAQLIVSDRLASQSLPRYRIPT